MATAVEIDFRQELLDRRQQIVQARSLTAARELAALLEDVDAALDRLARGTYGVCDVCGRNLGAAHLAVDPVARSCASHPSPGDRTRMRRDLALARQVQHSLLPPPDLALDGWRYQVPVRRPRGGWRRLLRHRAARRPRRDARGGRRRVGQGHCGVDADGEAARDGADAGGRGSRERRPARPAERPLRGLHACGRVLDGGSRRAEAAGRRRSLQRRSPAADRRGRRVGDSGNGRSGPAARARGSFMA